jgi:hypothetical protein
VIEEWMKNVQRILRLVDVDGVLHTQFICHACMSVSERAVVYLFYLLRGASEEIHFSKTTFISRV